MDIEIHNRWVGLKSQLRDPLYKNSFFIFFTKILVVATGFIFWLIAARLYPVEDVGLAVALVSSANLVGLFSMMGFEYSMIRYFSLHDTSKVINTSIILVTISSLVMSVLYIASVTVSSTDLSFVRMPAYTAFFILFVTISSIAVIIGYSFIAMRKSEYFFLQNIFISTRMFFIVPLVFLGTMGIFGSLLLAYLIASVFVFYVLGKYIKIDYRIDREYISKSIRYSSGNYIATLLYEVPPLVLPLMVLYILGEAEAARYFIAFTIGSFLIYVVNTLSTSLFVEGSYGESLKKNVVKAGMATYSLLIPGFLFIFLFGNYLLGIYGSDYVMAFDFLKLVALSSFFQAMYMIFTTIQKIRMGIRMIIVMNLLSFIALLGLSYGLIPIFGIAGVGYAIVITYAFLDMVIIGIAKKEGWF